MYPKVIKHLIEDFQKLPGIGEKTAERLALHVVTNFSTDEVESFSINLKRAKHELSFCQNCGLLTDINPCKICQNELRDLETMMIVSESRDVFLLEKTNSFRGQYHVLGGLIDFSRGITERDLNLANFKSRLSKIKELVIATNSTVEGEMTAQYIKAILQGSSIKITRLAYGIPAGSDLKYADSQTLSQAILNRRDF